MSSRRDFLKGSVALEVAVAAGSSDAADRALVSIAVGDISRFNADKTFMPVAASICSVIEMTAAGIWAATPGNPPPPPPVWSMIVILSTSIPATVDEICSMISGRMLSRKMFCASGPAALYISVIRFKTLT